VREERAPFLTNLCLPHQRLNLAAAVAAYGALGLPLAGVGEGATSIALSPWRGEERPRAEGGLLLNDAYNANPLSMRAALEALAARRNGARAVAILGEMAELGPETRRWHALTGARAAALGVDLLVAVGPLARAYLEGVRGRIDCCWFRDVPAAAAALPGLLSPSDAVLLKGSRSAGLERLVETISG
jgi:UDP-N-acetylmuramoyl-tripeptide--D-alanyl-D-alanine ligase